MSRADATAQYLAALKSGQKAYKNALGIGAYPYPPALSHMIDTSAVMAKVELGVVDVPAELIVGTLDQGRTSALASNFMPLLKDNTEFAAKWINLCAAHLSDEGIRDPIKCVEYMGKFYVEEGNKRTSVLKSYGSPTISAMVTRYVPFYCDDHDVQVYYEFMRFYEITGIYGLRFTHRLHYQKLLAKLGFDEAHIWTKAERSSFSAGYSQFKSAFDKVCPASSNVTAADAFLFWLGIFSFSETKNMPLREIQKNLANLWQKIEAENDLALDISTEPVEKSSNIITKLLGSQQGVINTAFIYGFTPDTSQWTYAHDLGRIYLEKCFGEKVTTKVYTALGKSEYFSAMENAVQDGAKVIFATLPTMIDSVRRIAALYPDVKIHVCSLSRPYPGVRNYYCRIYEAKFISGAIAGAIAENDMIGYLANYPIMGVPTAINAFAAGVKLTNPRAKILLRWSCTEGDHIREFQDRGINVISSRDAAKSPDTDMSVDMDWGLYMTNGSAKPLTMAIPIWNWGGVYEQIISGIRSGALNDGSLGLTVNYWWGMKAGVIDLQPGADLPSGVANLSDILKDGIINGNIDPFGGVLYDNRGNMQSDGSMPPGTEELMSMDWLMDNVIGELPGFDRIIEKSKDTVRLLGVYRHELPPEKEEKQL